MKVRFSGDALLAVKNAHAEYRRKSRALARSFAAEVRHTSTLIGDFPELGRPFAQYRRHPLRRFPFVLYYQEDVGHVEVIAVVHQSSDTEAPIAHGAAS